MRLVRYAARIIGAALFGSLLATAVFEFVETGVEEWNFTQWRLLFGFAVATMMFTGPGALMADGLDVWLRDRGYPLSIRTLVTCLVGRVIGELALAMSSLAFGIGALYGVATAIMLQILRQLKPPQGTAGRRLR